MNEARKAINKAILGKTISDEQVAEALRMSPCYFAWWNIIQPGNDRCNIARAGNGKKKVKKGKEFPNEGGLSEVCYGCPVFAQALNHLTSFLPK